MARTTASRRDACRWAVLSFGAERTGARTEDGNQSSNTALMTFCTGQLLQVCFDASPINLHFYTQRAVFDEAQILGNLTPNLHAQVVHHVLRDTLGRVPIARTLAYLHAPGATSSLRRRTNLAGGAREPKGYTPAG